jgi:hypothetical protein
MPFNTPEGNQSLADGRLYTPFGEGCSRLGIEVQDVSVGNFVPVVTFMLVVRHHYHRTITTERYSQNWCCGPTVHQIIETLKRESYRFAPGENLNHEN